MDDKKLHLIGNAHIDPVWLWRWQEGFHEVKATFRSALDRMKEYPDFRFTASSSIFYEWVEKNNPAMLEEIKERVAEGRWEIVGGWVIEPDCNIPSGESFVRQGLYGQRYFKKTFGKTATVGFNPDSFGHAGSLPQILVKQGLDSYVFMRPMPNEKALPSRVFWWHSADGSRVLTYRLPYEYCSSGGDIERFFNRLKPEFLDGAKELALFYGVGNHGGGPTRTNIECIHDIQKRENDYSISISDTEDFFASLRQSGVEYPVVQSDLQHHASGCYSVYSDIKKYNRLAENILTTAEKYSAVAHVLGKQPYLGDFEKAWKNVLFNQFHDILAGTSLVSAYDDARNAHGEAINIAETNANFAIQAISWDVDIPQEDDMFPLVVFNPHSWGGSMVCEIEATNIGNDECRLVDDNGKPVRIQWVHSESLTSGRQHRLLFVAELPSMGYRTFRLYTKQKSVGEFTNVTASRTALESGRFLLEINEVTGNVKRFYDKKLGMEVFNEEAAVLSVIEDKSDTWSHNVFKFDKEIATMKHLYTRVIEHGPVRSTIRVRYQYMDSYVTQEFLMYHDLDYVEVRLTTEWREPFTMLKIKFPVNVSFSKPTYEIPYGYIERSCNGEEEPGQNWFDLSGEYNRDSMCGLSIANTSKYGYSVDVNKMAITVLKNSVFAHHDPAKTDPETEYQFTDRGIDCFTFALYPHKGSWKEGRIANIAKEINVRPTVLVETYHAGSMPLSKSFLSVDNSQVTVCAVKESEDKDGVVVRAYETQGKHAEAVIDVSFMDVKIKASFKPCEIKTFKIPYGNGAKIVETNLLEWEMQK